MVDLVTLLTQDELGDIKLVGIPVLWFAKMSYYRILTMFDTEKE